MTGLVGALARFIVHCWNRAQQRRTLAHLDSRLLKDIGVSSRQVKSEIRKLPWQQ